jgi:hypothetical protein
MFISPPRAFPPIPPRAAEPTAGTPPPFPNAPPSPVTDTPAPTGIKKLFPPAVPEVPLVPDPAPPPAPTV